jgi:hypothetical protein
MALGSNQRLTEMSTRNTPGDKGPPARKADDLTAIYDCLDTVGASTSHNPMGLHGLLQVYLYFYLLLQCLECYKLLKVVPKIRYDTNILVFIVNFQ